MYRAALAQLTLVLTLLTGVFFSAQSPGTESRFTDIKGDPKLRSASALITDANGAVIYSKDINTVRPIASLTKLMTAMVILDANLDLNEKITITKQDRDLVRLTGSRLEYGARLSRKDLLLLALMSSENRAATALGRTYPGGMSQFVADMNRKARRLGMKASHFSDPAGLESGNRATAADLAKMLSAASDYSLIANASTTLRQQVRPYSSRGPLNYGNTNRLLRNKKWDIALSKTGYLDEAGRCLLMQANIDGETISIVLLNSFGKLTPFGDSNRLRQWMLNNS